MKNLVHGDYPGMILNTHISLVRRYWCVTACSSQKGQHFQYRIKRALQKQLPTLDYTGLRKQVQLPIHRPEAEDAGFNRNLRCVKLKHQKQF